MSHRSLSIQRNLKILNFNANGIKNQKYELQQLLSNYDIDLACITETHLKPKVKFNIRNYTIYRSDRLQRQGGGTAIFIKTTIPHRAANLPNFHVLEATGLFIHNNGTEILIASVYYPPYTQMEERDLDLLITHYNNFIFYGDFNA